MDKLKYPIVVLCGLQASGKDTILQGLVKDYNYTPIISHTSRPIRPNEQNGVEYHFVSYNDMITMQNNNELIESRVYYTLVEGSEEKWIYGISQNSINKDKQQIAILDKQGLQSFIDYFGKDNIISFVIYCPENVRKQRCKNRCSYDAREWNRREIADNGSFRDIYKIANHYVLNDNTTQTLQQVINEINDIVKDKIKMDNIISTK